jgi:cytidylate kinase
VLLDGLDVSSRIRERDVTEAASRVSVHPKVRQWMVARQRTLGEGGGVIMEGRDIGTKVFPDADVKIFLDAQPEVRQSRRILQRGAEEDREQARREAAALLERDMRDRTRTVSPLVPAEDAEIIDSSHMSVDEVVARAEQLARAKLRQ